MKNNTFKRVLAGSLALLSVAAYMPANVVVELGANGAALTAAAASTSTVYWDDDISEYIASISDGDTTTGNDIIKLTSSLKLNENAVLTIVSSVPLKLWKSAQLVQAADTVDLATKDGDTYTYENNYIVTESNGTYTYKVLNSKGLYFEGVDAPVAFINASGETLTLADKNTVETTKVEDDADITVNEDALKDVDSTYAQKTVLKITGKKAFEVYVKHNTVDAIEQYVAAYDTATGLFVANAIVPVTATGETVQVYFNKVIPNYTYENKGTELTATLDGTQVTAASISATYQNKVKTTKQEKRDENGAYYGKDYKYDTVTNLANGGTVANASRVELNFTNDTTGEITSKSADATPVNYSLKITRDGEEIAANAAVFASTDPTAVGFAANMYYSDVKSSSAEFVPGEAYDKDNTDGVGVLSFTQTGTYVVEYTVYTRVKDASGKVVLTPQTLKYQFTIDAKEALTAENVQLTAKGDKLKTTDSKFAVVDGVVEFEVAEDWTTANVIEVEPKLFGDPDVAETELTSDIVSITGTQKSSTLNNVNTMTITYNNSEYGTADKTVTVKWKLVEAKKEIVVKENEIYQSEHLDSQNQGVTFKSTPYFETTIDNLDTIEEDIYAALTIENAEPSAVTFEYVEGFGANADSEELYYHEDGLPTAKGEYSVFAMYEGEIVAAFNVEIAEHALYAAPTAEQLSYTYGTKKLSCDDLKFEDIDGKVVEDAGVKNASITYNKARELKTVESQKIVDGKFNNLDVFVVDGKNYVADTSYDENSDYLNAGVYIATVKGGSDTTVAKEGYAVQPSSFAVKVAQKKITSDMITFAAQTYTGKSLSPIVDEDTAKDTAVKDKDGNPVKIAVKIADNTTSASAVGEYTVNVQVDETASPNYTGKVAAKWHIVKEATVDSMKGLEFVDQQTTIYNNGQIHFEVNRPDDTQFQNGVAKFGVVFDKNGKLAAPEKELNEENELKYPKFAKDAKDKSAFDAATAALQVGNGYGEGNQSDKLRAENPTKYGANLNVVDVETGAWLRPYVVDGKGNIYYGDVVYVNLVQEATEALNLKLANFNYDSQTTVVTKDEAKEDQSAAALANKTWRDEVKIGYSTKKNSYYVYGSYTLAKDSNVKSDAVQGFGVVVDKKGAVDYTDYSAILNPLTARYNKLSDTLNAAPATTNNDDYSAKFNWLRTAFLASGYDEDSNLVKALDKVRTNSTNTQANREALRDAYNAVFDPDVRYTENGNNSYYNGWNATSTSSNNLANALINSMKTKLTTKMGELDPIIKPLNDLNAAQYAAAADELKLGNGFIEGKSGSNKMDIDEYGAMITPYNTVTGVWVRAYVDLGNNLVVYTDPIYIKDISSIYNPFDENVGIISVPGASCETADDLPVGWMNYIDDLEKQRVVFKPTIDVEGEGETELAKAGAKLKNAGVVVDKSGSFLKKEDGAFLTEFAEKDAREVCANLILGNGYVQGKKPNTGDTPYAANITQETYRVTEAAGLTNIPLVVRPYAIYDINGKDVVVYGEPVVSQVNEATQKN